LTALHIATLTQQIKLISLLLKLGAVVDVRDPVTFSLCLILEFLIGVGWLHTADDGFVLGE
jgi:hypothetical protein